MPVQFISNGLAAVPDYGPQATALDRRLAALSNLSVKASIDPQAHRRLTGHLETAGYDGWLVAERSGWPEVSARVAWSIPQTRRLLFMAAHRIGRQSPTTAARLLQTLDQLSGGRVAFHMITGHTDADQRRDGDFLSKPDRYRRAAEFLEVFTRTLEATDPFDYEGEYYRVAGASSGLVASQARRPQISWAGNSPAAIEIAAKYCDIFALASEPLAGTGEILDRVRTAADRHGRTLTFWHNANHIVARTDREARALAESIADRLQARADSLGLDPSVVAGPESLSRKRLHAAALEADWHDRALYTRISRITGAEHVPSFVGSPETIAEALMEYYDLGIRIFGCSSDVFTAEERTLKIETLRLVREAVAEREAAQAHQAVAERRTQPAVEAARS